MGWRGWFMIFLPLIGGYVLLWVGIFTWVRQGYIDPVVSNEKTISLISAPPVAAAAAAVVAGFAFFAGDGAFSSFFTLVVAAGFWNKTWTYQHQ